MKHYNKKFIKKYIKQLEKDGFSCVDNGKHITIKKNMQLILKGPLSPIYIDQTLFHAILAISAI